MVKLVRDKNCRHHAQSGLNTGFFIADNLEYKNYLYKKLQEKIADILEIIDAVIEHKKFNINQIKKRKKLHQKDS